MPLYAFDGTWNLDKPGTEHDTNVVWFHDAYTGPKHYFKGIGTRFGAVGRIVGGITGAGGRDRIKEALDAHVEDANQEGRLFEVWFRGVPIDPTLVDGNAGRINPLAQDSHHDFGMVDGRRRAVRWNDVVHASVSFRASDATTPYNNPPANLAVVDDEGRETGRFQAGVLAGV